MNARVLAITASGEPGLISRIEGESALGPLADDQGDGAVWATGQGSTGGENVRLFSLPSGGPAVDKALAEGVTLGLGLVAKAIDRPNAAPPVLGGPGAAAASLLRSVVGMAQNYPSLPAKWAQKIHAVALGGKGFTAAADIREMPAARPAQAREPARQIAPVAFEVAMSIAPAPMKVARPSTELSSTEKAVADYRAGRLTQGEFKGALASIVANMPRPGSR